MAGRVLTVYARTGLPAGLTVTPAAELLAEYAATHPASRVLIIDAAFALPALVTAPTAAVAVAQRHAGMLVASQRTLTNAKRTGIDWLEGKIILDNIIIKITLLKNGKNT